MEKYNYSDFGKSLREKFVVIVGEYGGLMSVVTLFLLQHVHRRWMVVTAKANVDKMKFALT